MESGEVTEEESVSCDTPLSQHIFELMFPLKENFDNFYDKIRVALENAINDESKQQNNNKCHFEIISNNDDDTTTVRVYLNQNTRDSPTPARNKQMLWQDKEKSPDYTGLAELFTIDSTPAEKLDTVNVPSYKRSISTALDEETSKRQKVNEATNACPRPLRRSCFNCDSTAHELRQCPKPPNSTRINRAKKAMASKNERYHVDVEQRFADLRPGHISKSLKHALGLRSGQLPSFFYRMRVLGYPPGWLEDAKVSQSGISIFNSNGEKVLDDDQPENASNGLSHKYDVSKIIDFPGFNADPGSNFFDDYEHHNVPPFSQLPRKADFIKSLGDQIVKSYKRKKLKDTEKTEHIVDHPANCEVTDMVVSLNDSDNDETTKTPIDVNEDDQSTSSSTEDMRLSPSIETLEAQQAQLRRELETSTDQLNNQNHTEEDETESLNNTKCTPIVANNSEIAKDSNDDNTPRRDIIKTSSLGTPVLKFSIYDTLPGGSNFKEGVSDVINFENLPDSTGKYEQMKLLIAKVRNIRRRLNDDEDNTANSTS